MAEDIPSLTAVVDANVIAYYLLDTEPFVQEARRFWHRAREVFAPALWEDEILNIVWLTTRAGIIDAGEGLERLRHSRALGINTVPARNLWRGAFLRALTHAHPPYDALYVELAARLGLPLATFDEEILKKFPDIATRPGRL